MRHLCTAVALTLLAAGCAGSGTGEAGTAGKASVSLDGATYAVHEVSFELGGDDTPWFRIDGAPAVNDAEDCVPGLGGGFGFYGDLPPGVRKPADLPGKRLKVEFSGDGDDANFCFVGMDGLAGAEDAWVTIDAVDGDRVRFSMDGTFKIYDGNGNGPVKRATATGTAVLHPGS